MPSKRTSQTPRKVSARRRTAVSGSSTVASSGVTGSLSRVSSRCAYKTAGTAALVSARPAMNPRREIVIALPVSAMEAGLSQLERSLLRQIYRCRQAGFFRLHGAAVKFAPCPLVPPR
ncbi:hypothetical protein D9M71_754390 [compost metagenome]